MKEQIKIDIISAMKSKDSITRDVLRVVLGEINRNKPDVDVIKLIKKMVENIKEVDGSKEEISVLERYLPQPLTRLQLENIVNEFIVDNDVPSTMKSMGLVMGHLNKTYPNRFDGKEASTIIREVLI